jgi:hypothetical protein
MQYLHYFNTIFTLVYILQADKIESDTSWLFNLSRSRIGLLQVSLQFRQEGLLDIVVNTGHYLYTEQDFGLTRSNHIR